MKFPCCRCPNLSFSNILLYGILFVAALFCSGCPERGREFLNVSYDPTRELYEEYNRVFSEHWKNETGEEIRFRKSNGGSGSQARNVINGLSADVVTLALGYDIDNIHIAENELLPADWQEKLPNNSCPYTSTIVFLVRKGNPKGIRDWDDLLKNDVRIITPDPQTSGGARWNYLAAWGYALKKELGDFSALNDSDGTKQTEIDAAHAQAFQFVKGIFNKDKVPVMDKGARAATNTFVQSKRGDVLLAWENEALFFLQSREGQTLEVVVPSVSILAEPPVAVIEKNARKNGNMEVARRYLEYLFEPEGQEICAKHFYRPYDREVLAKYSDRFRDIELFTIDEVFGGWKNAQKTHFDDGGTFSQIGKP